MTVGIRQHRTNGSVSVFRVIASRFCQLQRADRISFVLRVVVAMLVLLACPIIEAKDKPPVGLKLELMSIRNRSSGPLPVHVKLEYNLPQILEGDLELSIYDALDTFSRDDLMAKILYEDIVLAGRDYEFNIVLPPLRTAVTQNWAIEAFFVTENERIPLSSVPDGSGPPQAHDLLTTSPLERGVLVCSCSTDPVAQPVSANRKFLEENLSLDNYNPLYEELEQKAIAAGDPASGAAQAEKIGRTIIHFAGQWSAKDLPQDPLSYCAFDMVLLSDGALARLTTDQLAGLTKWVRGGGSVCVLPDVPMKPQHLDFLRTLFEHGTGNPANLTLDSEGRLLVVSDVNDPVLFSHFGLGRAVLLPSVESLEQRLNSEELGSVVAFLWKVRRNQAVWKGKPWTGISMINQLKTLGIDAQQDERGVYVTEGNVRQLSRYFYGGVQISNGRFYLRREHLKSMFGINDQINPRTEALLAFAEQSLLPSDVEMVPAWMLALILCGYVLTIGPIDYFVLGWLRIRKYTWILFPIVTLAFTFIMIAAANRYMGSDDTGGKLVITDVVDDGIVARQTVLSTLFVGAQSEIRTSHTTQLVVQAEDSFSAADWPATFGQGPEKQPDVPLNYFGHFPQNYSIAQKVQQWSPVSLRTLSLEPDDVKLPAIDWSDQTLVTTPEGNEKLRQAIHGAKTVSGMKHMAVVYHNGSISPLYGEYQEGVQTLQPNVLYPYNNSQPPGRDAAFNQLLSFLPTSKTQDQSFFRIVSQVSPEGAGSLEDLAFLDAADPEQWALVVMRSDGENIEVFRKLYIVR